MSELYLRERRYENHFKQSYCDEKVNRWYSVLGEKMVDSLAENIETISRYLKNESWVCEQVHIYKKNMIEPHENSIIFPKDYINDCKSDFFALYREILECGYYFLYNRDKQVYKLSDNILRIFFQYFIRKMDEISICSIIQEIKIIKNDCKNVTDAYEFLLHKIIDKEFRKDFYSRYPVLKRCLCEFVHTRIGWIKDVFAHFEQDKELIENELLCGKRIRRIYDIEMLSSDTHNGGKCVLKFKVDTGDYFIYKPHDVKNEVFFNRKRQIFLRIS